MYTSPIVHDLHHLKLLILTVFEVPSTLKYEFVERPKQFALSVEIQGHVILNGIQSSKNQVEQANLKIWHEDGVCQCDRVETSCVVGRGNAESVKYGQ